MYRIELRKDLVIKMWLVKCVPVFAILIIVLAGVVYGLGARSFAQGFVYALGIWMILELCVVLGFNFGWYTHVKLTPKVNSDGQINEYPLCSFYISKIAKSIVAGVLVSAIIGWMIYSVI